MLAAILDKPHVREFLSSISQEAPFYVMVRPWPQLVAGDCFNNVDRMIARKGGEAVRGWVIHEWPGVFIEAEYHHTWRKPDGTLEDPTPRIDRRKRLPFLPDSSVHPAQFPDNIRKSLCDDALILEYWSAFDSLKLVGSSALVSRVAKLKTEIESKYGKEPE